MTSGRHPFFAAVALSAFALCAPAFAGSPSVGQAGAKSDLAASSGASTPAASDRSAARGAIPERVTKVFCTTPVGTALVYSLAPEKLVSWNFPLEEGDLVYVDRKYLALPALGGSGNQFNTEEIIRAAPDLIVDFEGAGQAGKTKKLIEATGIPCLTCGNGIDDIPAAYRVLGKALGVPERGELLASYIENRLAKLRSELAAIPDAKLARVYYAESPDGLKTDGSDSVHTQLFNYVRAVNVVTEKSGANMKGLNASLEQVLLWNPDVIIASRHLGGDQFVSSVYANADWSSVSAVKAKRVYLAPSGPFDWFDRPPCMMRALGAIWLAKTLYPSYVSFDLRAETKSFYKTFFGYRLDDAGADALLRGSVD